MRLRTHLQAMAIAILALWLLSSSVARGAQDNLTDSGLPAGPLSYGAFTAEFAADGDFVIEGQGWPRLAGKYTLAEKQEPGATTLPTLELRFTGKDAPPGCDGPGRYSYARAADTLTFTLIEDGCRPRQMIVGNSTWRPAGVTLEQPPREITVHFAGEQAALPKAVASTGSWPGFRGRGAGGVADGTHLPERWNVESGENIAWRVPVDGLAHSSPTVWGDRVFVTTAVSSEGDATFRRGLYGDGDAATDRSEHRFELWAFDKGTGELLYKRVATRGEPRDKRHIKSTYANASPATDGVYVVAWFGSQGLFVYDVEGRLRWSADLGRMNLGAYDVPSYEWGPASSPVLWDGKVILQVDTQLDSFVIAFDASSGEILWKTERDEAPTWGTPTVIEGPSGPELVTNGAKRIRGYDPRNGRELWWLGGSSKITAPTPFLANGLLVVASGRAPERPIFVIRPGARGDISLGDGEESNRSVAWMRNRRGPYMPTPIAYDGRLYVLANNGVFDTYDLATGKEIYRQRLDHRGSGFSASPVAADGKLYLSSEDGDILVVRAGAEFEQLAINSMNEPLMATPALSDGMMFVRSQSHLTAIRAISEPAKPTAEPVE